MTFRLFYVSYIKYLIIFPKLFLLIYLQDKAVAMILGQIQVSLFYRSEQPVYYVQFDIMFQ